MTTSRVRSASLAIAMALLAPVAFAETPDTNADPAQWVVGDGYKVSTIWRPNGEGIEGVLVKQSDEWARMSRKQSCRSRPFVTFGRTFRTS